MWGGCWSGRTMARENHQNATMPNYHLHISSQRRNGHDNRRELLQCSKPLGLFDELYPFFEALTIISLTRALLVPGITPCKAWASLFGSFRPVGLLIELITL